MWLARPGLEGDPSAWRPQPAGTHAPPADSAEAQSHDQLNPPANAAQSAEAPAIENGDAAIFFVHPTSYYSKSSRNATLGDAHAHYRADPSFGERMCGNEVGETVTSWSVG